jgi:hypothetical protein
MKKILLLLLVTLAGISSSVNAQTVATYNFAASSGTYTALTTGGGATAISDSRVMTSPHVVFPLVSTLTIAVLPTQLYVCVLTVGRHWRVPVQPFFPMPLQTYRLPAF